MCLFRSHVRGRPDRLPVCRGFGSAGHTRAAFSHATLNLRLEQLTCRVSVGRHLRRPSWLLHYRQYRQRRHRVGGPMTRCVFEAHIRRVTAEHLHLDFASGRWQNCPRSRRCLGLRLTHKPRSWASGEVLRSIVPVSENSRDNKRALMSRSRWQPRCRAVG